MPKAKTPIKLNKLKSKLILAVAIVSSIAVVATANLTVFNDGISNIGSSFASAQEPADINSDNTVDIVDLSILLSDWNKTGTTSDLNSDGTVDIIDLSMLLSKWGEVQASREKILGLNDHPFWLAKSQAEAFEMIVDSNAKALRIDIPWDFAEPVKGVPNEHYLSRIDSYVNRAVNTDIDILMILTDSPEWASGTSDRRAPPLNNNDYADFLEYLINRYSGKVNAFEIWNEPNGGWAWTNPDPVRYASLLETAYNRAKNIDPNLKILGPSLSGPDQGAFLNAFYQAGGKDYFDIFSMHGYWWNINGSEVVPYYDEDNPDQSIFGQFNTRILPIMQAYGDEKKPIWWTETGIATSGSITSETDQVNKLNEIFIAWQNDVIPTMERLYWYQAFDQVGTGSEQNFGLIDNIGTSTTMPNPEDFVTKPSYDVFKQNASTL